jgi:hypothetical protein
MANAMGMAELGPPVRSAGKDRIRSFGSGSFPNQRWYASRAKITGIRSWISAISSFAFVVMIAKVRCHSPELGSFQFSQTPVRPNGAPSHRDGIGLLRLQPFDAFHSKKLPTSTMQRLCDRHPKGWKISDGLAFGIDGLATAKRVFAPMRDQAPAHGIEGHLASLLVTPNGEQF